MNETYMYDYPFFSAETSVEAVTEANCAGHEDRTRVVRSQEAKEKVFETLPEAHEQW